MTPFANLRHFTSRNYGNPIGVFRNLNALKVAGLRALFPVKAVPLEKKCTASDAILARMCEIAAFANAGLSPRTWMSPARQQNTQTPDLIKATDFDICRDWESDSNGDGQCQRLILV